MKIKTLYQDNEEITLESYLNKCGIDDIGEFIKGGAKGIEDCNNYDNMEKGYELILAHVLGGDDNVNE